MDVEGSRTKTSGTKVFKFGQEVAKISLYGDPKPFCDTCRSPRVVPNSLSPIGPHLKRPVSYQWDDFAKKLMDNG